MDWVEAVKAWILCGCQTCELDRDSGAVVRPVNWIETVAMWILWGCQTCGLGQRLWKCGYCKDVRRVGWVETVEVWVL